MGLSMTLDQVEKRLWQWGIPREMWSCARSRGMSSAEFAETYRRFIEAHYGKANRQGKVIFEDVHRARLWAFFWLRDNGFPSMKWRVRHDPDWHDPEVKSKSGRD